MRPDDLLEFTRKTPFEPFRITLTDGRTFDVLHPEMAMVGRSSMTIGVPGTGDPRPIYDRAVMVSLLHVMQLELIEPTRKGGNGSPG